MNDVDPQTPDDDTGEFEPVTTGNEPEDSYAELRPLSQDDWLHGMHSWMFDHAGFSLIALLIFLGPRMG